MNSLAGTGGLARLILRRDRILMPIWVLILSVIPIEYTAATERLYPTAEARLEYFGSIIGNPGLLAALGPAYNSSVGALGVWRSGPLYAIIGLVSLLTVIRHTRTEEDAGRRELLGSGVVGRSAPLTAALIVTMGANLLIGLFAIAGMLRLGHPAAGSLAFGLSLAAAGWIFAAVGAIAAQLTQGAGGARGIAISVLGAAFLLRAAGDSGGEGGRLSWLSWLSPLGWTEQIRAFAGERWWVFILLIGLFALLGAVAFRLMSRRDLGAGILPARLGPAVAAPGLGSPLALAWRLQRGLLLGWTAGFAFYGVVVGSVAKSAADIATESPQMQKFLERLGGTGGISDAYIATVIGIGALAAAGYAIQSALRLRAEETSLRAEPVLATSVGRLRWEASHLVFAMFGPAVALTAGGLTAGLSYGLTVSDVGGQLPRMLAASFVQMPAVWILAGIAVALFGLLPRFAMLSWAALALCLLIGQVAAMLQLSQWVMDISPFNHVPRLPGGEVTAAPLIVMTALAVALTLIGIAGFRRRDIG